MNVSVRVPEPKRFNGNSAKLEMWIYSLKVYFGAIGWDVSEDGEQATRGAELAAALLDGPAL